MLAFEANFQAAAFTAVRRKCNASQPSASATTMTGIMEPRFNSLQPCVVTSTPEASELTANVANTKKFRAPWARSFSSGV